MILEKLRSAAPGYARDGTMWRAACIAVCAIKSATILWQETRQANRVSRVNLVDRGPKNKAAMSVSRSIARGLHRTVSSHDAVQNNLQFFYRSRPASRAPGKTERPN
jgi:hypothetical protein